MPLQPTRIACLPWKMRRAGCAAKSRRSYFTTARNSRNFVGLKLRGTGASERTESDLWNQGNFVSTTPRNHHFRPKLRVPSDSTVILRRDVAQPARLLGKPDHAQDRREDSARGELAAERESPTTKTTPKCDD